jgi:acylphosphatase
MKEASVRHVVIRGRVQGVGFRAWIEYEALKRDMAGWVRNRRDGSVEAVFAGPADVVAAMIETSREGPPGSRVDTIEEQADGQGALKFCRAGERFSVLPTL